jgi:hypothetical protein
VSRAEEFQQLRPLLSSIVYRILGSVSEAESVVPSLTGTPRFVPIYRGGLHGRRYAGSGGICGVQC